VFDKKRGDEKMLRKLTIILLLGWLAAARMGSAQDEARLSITPIGGTAETTITLTGLDWPADTLLAITWDGEPFAEILSGPFGGWRYMFLPPASEPGAYEVTVRAPDGTSRRAAFEIGSGELAAPTPKGDLLGYERPEDDGTPMRVDGLPEDWARFSIVNADEIGDGTGEIDVTALRAFTNLNALYLLIECESGEMADFKGLEIEIMWHGRRSDEETVLFIDREAGLARLLVLAQRDFVNVSDAVEIAYSPAVEMRLPLDVLGEDPETVTVGSVRVLTDDAIADHAGPVFVYETDELDEKAAPMVGGGEEAPVPITGAVISQQWVNMRGGPGTNYDVTGAARNETELLILGRDPDSAWLYVERVEDGLKAWIAAYLMEISVPVEEIPLAPTPVPPISRTPTLTLTPASEQPAATTPTTEPQNTGVLDAWWSGVSGRTEGENEAVHTIHIGAVGGGGGYTYFRDGEPFEGPTLEFRWTRCANVMTIITVQSADGQSKEVPVTFQAFCPTPVGCGDCALWSW
jgi:hypothetical protein